MLGLGEPTELDGEDAEIHMRLRPVGVGELGGAVLSDGPFEIPALLERELCRRHRRDGLHRREPDGAQRVGQARGPDRDNFAWIAVLDGPHGAEA